MRRPPFGGVGIVLPGIPATAEQPPRDVFAAGFSGEALARGWRRGWRG